MNEQNKGGANTAAQAAQVQTKGYGRQEEKEIDLAEMFFMLVGNWKALLLGLLIGAVLLGAYRTLIIKPTYRATTQMYVTNTNENVISYQDLQVGNALTEDYKEIITSGQVLNQVIEDLDLNVTYKGLQNLINVTNPSNTHIIKTSVTTRDLVLSRDIANDLLMVSMERIQQLVGYNEPSIINIATAELVEDATPSLSRYVMIGALIGFLVVAIVLIIRMISNTTIRTEDDIENVLHLPVLAAVPYYND